MAKGGDGKVVPLARKGGKCPVCQSPSQSAYHPFCSQRCADVDLGRWLKGSYRIPGEPADLADDGIPDDRNDDPDGRE